MVVVTVLVVVQGGLVLGWALGATLPPVVFAGRWSRNDAGPCKT
jgi:hypothetical protein